MATPTIDSQKLQQQGTLYVVATPIGNFADVSERMRHTLASVSKIAAEDTRRTGLLLSHLQIDTPCFSFHDHNERQKLDWIVQLLQAGESIALVSDAGTPLISDPGYPLIARLRENGMEVTAIPGPCALITALSIAGLPTDRFVFEGFLSSKSSSRKAQLEAMVEQTATSILYESSHRIKACLEDIRLVFGKDRRIVVARELTKTFETVLDGSIEEILDKLNSDHNQSKGEFVVMIKGQEKKPNILTPESEKLALTLSRELPSKKVSSVVSEIYGVKKKLVYDFLISEKNKEFTN